MKTVAAPNRSLTLRDSNTMSATTLRVTPSSQGDPYRPTLVLSFESGAHGAYENYEHIASVELEPEEVCQLRDLLNARHAPCRA